MDCLKNLTACMGCTKKHAKCSWKDVREEELRDGRSIQVLSSPENGHTVIDLELVENVADDIRSTQRTPLAEIAQVAQDEAFRTAALAQVVVEEKVEIPTPPAEARPSSIGQQLQEAANGRTHHSKYTLVPPLRESIEQDDNDEGDRLQALAAQVYRTASQNEPR